MSIKKQLLKRKATCKTTFKIPKEVGMSSDIAHVVGDFNNWELKDEMKRLKDKSFTITLNLPKGEEFQFRYILNKEVWTNEPEADKEVQSPFSDSKNSVLLT